MFLNYLCIHTLLYVYVSCKEYMPATGETWKRVSEDGCQPLKSGWGADIPGLWCSLLEWKPPHSVSGICRTCRCASGTGASYCIQDRSVCTSGLYSQLLEGVEDPSISSLRGNSSLDLKESCRLCSWSVSYWGDCHPWVDKVAATGVRSGV